MKSEKSLVKIPVGKQHLVGTLFIPGKQSYPGVIFYHGSSSSQQGYIPRAEKLAEKGMVALTFDFRGCGQSPETLNEQTIKKGIEDALAAYDFFSRQSVVDSEKIGICGTSYGGYLAAIVSSKRPIKSLILRSPAVYKDQWANTPLVDIDKRQKEALRSLQSNSQNSIAIDNLRHFKGSLLIIESEKDEIIPHQTIENYWKSAGKVKNKKMAVIENAAHYLPPGSPQDQQFVRLTVDWFTETL